MQASRGTDDVQATHPTPPRPTSREQLRALYVALLMNQDRFDEFKQLLARYPKPLLPQAEESTDATAVRHKLDQRISLWISAPFAGLAPQDVLVWRAVLVDEQLNISLAASLGLSF